MIAVVDYGMGNLRSVSKAIESVGGDVEVTSSPKRIEEAEAVVLPGVGAFKDAVRNLKELNLWETLIRQVEKGKPFLGICLGLQLLFDVSYEFGESEGLKLIRGEVVRFRLPPEFKIPHMGWNQVYLKKESKLFEGIKEGEFFYFVHSFYVKPEEPGVTLTETDYGITFTSAVEKENLFAVQFHPEKSQRAGLKLLENFLSIVKSA
ncbi:imidazole glycerol phosphate synthase subunit HisH [Thermovibrio ammonificans]